LALFAGDSPNCRASRAHRSHLHESASSNVIPDDRGVISDSPTHFHIIYRWRADERLLHFPKIENASQTGDSAWTPCYTILDGDAHIPLCDLGSDRLAKTSQQNRRCFRLATWRDPVCLSEGACPKGMPSANHCRSSPHRVHSLISNHLHWIPHDLATAQNALRVEKPKKPLQVIKSV
jgi:hypothetical protein